MNILGGIKRLLTRNLAMSSMFESTLPQPVYTNWTVQKAVKDGYRANGWVYRSVYLISKSAASVPWKVYDGNDEPVEGHHLGRLFEKPNPHISRQDMFELMTSWLELAGNSYLYRNVVNGRTAELWPISPDRIRPIPGKAADEWLTGYALDHKPGAAYLPEDIVHHKFLDPSNPLVGISPLEVAGKTVDVDNAQRDFNMSTSQNRGVIDGVFTFERMFNTFSDGDAVSEQIAEKLGKKRGFLVLGSNAKYQRLAMTPAEMDFADSRKWNREEICVIFGIPLPLISQERATYDNYSTAELIFWTMTLIPLLDDLADGFNFSLDSELQEGHRIGYDVSNVPAIRRAMLDRAKTAEILFGMGVPMEQINRLFDLGVEEYDGWEESRPRSSGQTAEEEDREAPQGQASGYTLADRPLELRAISEDVEKAAQGEIKADFAELLEKQRKRVFQALEAGFDQAADIKGVLSEDNREWEEAMGAHFLDVALEMGAKVVVEKREINEPLAATIREYLDHEQFLLTEKAMIDATTTDVILGKVVQGLKVGWDAGQLQQAIIDSGAFGEERALRLARTLAGSAASTGQWHSAKMAGAEKKTWEAASGARKEHADRDGETVGIDERFSPKFGERVGPRWPLDPYLPPADRVNCRCAMSFSA